MQAILNVSLCYNYLKKLFSTSLVLKVVPCFDKFLKLLCCQSWSHNTENSKIGTEGLHLMIGFAKILLIAY